MKIDLFSVQQSLLDDISQSFSDTKQLNKATMVYTLVQIRKVLEISNLEEEDKFIALNFFIDWSLHARKNRNGKWYQFLKEKVFASIENSKRILATKGIVRNININDVWSHEFYIHISLRNLHENLEAFSAHFRIDFSTLFKTENFDCFRNVLMEVLSETPIEIKDSECPIGAALIQSSKNKLKFSQEEGMAKHVCDYILSHRDGTFVTVSFLDGTMPIGARDVL